MTDDIIRVLLVEDNPADTRLLKEYFGELRETPFLVSEADCISGAIDHVAKRHFDVILLDLSLPDSHGLETIHRMHTHAPGMALIVLTGVDDDELALGAMRHGAQDYLVKGKFDIQLLSRAIRYTIERKRSEAAIKKLAYYDTLTGLPNRVLFSDRLKQAIVMAERDKRDTALLFLDLDNFKNVNDSIGHTYGDRLLKITADRIQGCLRGSDTVARIGGDEFVVILPLVTGAEDVSKVAAKILDCLNKTVRFEEHEIYSSASIGISVFPDDGATADELLKNADIALYQAKERGRNNFQFFSKEMNVQALTRQLIESSMRQAITRDEFYLVYQPQFDIGSRRVVGLEALLRWHHPQKGNIYPLHFIAIAEETGLSRETLYRTLSPRGNPTLRTLMAVTHAAGLRLRVEKAHA